MNPNPPKPPSRVSKLLKQLSKEADRQNMDYLIITFPRPDIGQMTMNAEVAFKITNPVNMGSILSTLGRRDEKVAGAYAAMHQISALAAAAQAVKDQQQGGAKIIDKDGKKIILP